MLCIYHSFIGCFDLRTAEREKTTTRKVHVRKRANILEMQHTCMLGCDLREMSSAKCLFF